MIIGIIGPPKSGKTTIFNAVTRGHAETAAYATSGAEINAGVAKVPDPRLQALEQMYSSKRVVPAEVQYVDVPGGARRPRAKLGNCGRGDECAPGL